ncbi:hypothetical protein E2F43_18800 [Seongchinamella unica]|uniref:Uncharacterized protein n=1 Tax=Seongchinamella unica TaxID=2547392 RepID=A0A4R5LMP9_9GAMM|nr:hypothetical protein [Seongchinamella unica]TDG11306.1 hypothetical protein E2F43_18800 [Seongchinamella unica]
MVSVKPGARLKSTVCDTEVMVVRGSGEIDLRCGGSALTESGGSAGGTPSEDFAAGSLIGKRYVDTEANIELLCIRGGAGSLSLGEVKLSVKRAEALPSSD